MIDMIILSLSVLKKVESVVFGHHHHHHHHHPNHTWHDSFLAGGTLGGVLMGVTLCAEQEFILGSKGLFHQRAAALGTLKALLMPVAVLV